MSEAEQASRLQIWRFDIFAEWNHLSRLKKAAAEGWAEKITGQCVRAVRVHGKNLFIDFANGWTLYTHMLMWGTWHIYAQGEPWRKEARKARMVLETATHCAVLFSAPVCQLLHASELATHPTSALGPDLLADTFGPPERAEIRRLQAQSDASIGEAIMNQAVMAGIGNILKSEILFAARINPQRPANSLTDEEFECLVGTSQDMMRRAYDTHSFTQVFLPPALRQAADLVTRKDRGRFERALQELQRTFNIARSPASDSADVWVPFQQQYPQFVA